MQLHCRKWHRWPASCWKPGRDKNGFPCRSQRNLLTPWSGLGASRAVRWWISFVLRHLACCIGLAKMFLLFFFFFSIQYYGKTQKDFFSNPILCYGRPRKPIQSVGRRKTTGIPPALLAEGTFVVPLRTHLLDPPLQWVQFARGSDPSLHWPQAHATPLQWLSAGEVLRTLPGSFDSRTPSLLSLTSLSVRWEKGRGGCSGGSGHLNLSDACDLSKRLEPPTAELCTCMSLNWEKPEEICGAGGTALQQQGEPADLWQCVGLKWWA